MASRFFRHGELPLVLLTLFSDRPMHGYEVMSELTRLFGPAYRPSPGSIYPAVEALEAEGLIEGEILDGRKTYSATSTGVEAVEKRADSLAALEVRTGARIRDTESLEPIFARFKARVAAHSRRIDPGVLQAVLDRTATEIENMDRLTNGADHDD